MPRHMAPRPRTTSRDQYPPGIRPGEAGCQGGPVNDANPIWRENQLLRAALEFYADPANYKLEDVPLSECPQDGGVCDPDRLTRIDDDGGLRAREAFVATQ